ncbi:PilN domain-containing protein [Caldibacillus lycopersici]|uniref:PilN domain-containing protein n=1 Tax=Perspicuibacillus lycopersici TaxID=1325689 RepID=A0AAE3LQZ6_9BACI|nr:PilN domain-containing protein [Perspicuibacillus lycopersici]MCU9614019.1 PilN domain-containing protein [Perspicuibacillus lycopersici]
MIPNINLLPKYERKDSRIFIIVLTIAVAWLLLLLFSIYQYVLANSDIKLLQKQTESATLERAVLEKQLHMIDVEQLATIQDAITYVEGITVPTSIVIEELNQLLPNTSYLRQYSYNNGEISIQSEFASMNTIAQYITALDASEIISDAVVNTITANAGDTVTSYNVSFIVRVNREELVKLDRGEDND